MTKKADRYYMPFYVERWLTSTAGMTAAQKGVYIDLLALQYANPAGIVTDNQVAFTVSPRDPEATAEILAAKFERVAGGYRNARLEERREHHNERADAGRKGGLASAQKRADKRAAQSKLTQAKPQANGQPNAPAKGQPQDGIPRRNTEYQNQNQGRNSGIPESGAFEGEKERQAIGLAVTACRQLPDPTAPNDRRLVAAAAVLAVTELTEHWFFDSLGGVTNLPASKPYAKLHAVLRTRAQEMYQADFDALAAALAIPRSFYQSVKDQLETSA